MARGITSLSAGQTTPIQNKKLKHLYETDNKVHIAIHVGYIVIKSVNAYV